MNRTIEKNKEFIEIIEKIRASRDVYKDGISDVVDAYKDKLKWIDGNCVKDSENYKQEREKAERTLNLKKEQMQKDIREYIFSDLNMLKIKIQAEVSAVPKHTLERLLPLLDLSVSRFELCALCESFGGDYWSDKVLTELARKNDIQGDLPCVRASAEDRLDVIDALYEEFDKLLESYPGRSDAEYRDNVLLSDRRLNELEQIYTRGNASLNSEQTATRAVADVLSKGDVMERGLALNAHLKKVDAETQRRMLAKVADADNSQQIFEFAGMGKGRTDAMKEIAKGEIALKTDAEKAVDMVLNARDLSIRGQAGYMSYLLNENDNNPYFGNPYLMETLEKQRLKNSQASAILDCMASADAVNRKNKNDNATVELIDAYTKEIEKA